MTLLVLLCIFSCLFVKFAPSGAHADTCASVFPSNRLATCAEGLAILQTYLPFCTHTRDMAYKHATRNPGNANVKSIVEVPQRRDSIVEVPS